MNRYKIVERTEQPLVKKIRQKYDEMYLFGELDKTCEMFGISPDLFRKIAYSRYKADNTTLTFDTIIRLSNMLDIPYEEFINYNAVMVYNRNEHTKYTEEEIELLKQYNVGKQWEDEVIAYYSERDYFVYKIPTMNSGTVFDIIAIKKGSALMIECKHIDSDKLYYGSNGLLKKRDELDHFVNTTQNNIYIYVKSEKTGTWWTTWLKAKPIFENKGYICKEDCFPCNLNNKEDICNTQLQ